MSFFLGLDIGTTSVKAAVFDLSGGCLGVGSQDYRLDTPAPDRVEIDPERYWTAASHVVRQAISAAATPPEAILAMGVSSQGESTICVDQAGKPLYPALVWLDHRAQAEAQALAKTLGEAAYARTGIPTIDPTWTACKIAWIRDHEPDVFAQTYRFLLVQSFIVQRLTGAFVTDGGAACTTLLLDITTHDWWGRALDAVGLSPQQLPDLKHVGEVAGSLTREAAEALGLTPGMPVVLGGMDQIAGAVGAGNLSPEVVSESTGGALTIHVTVDRPDLDPLGRIPVYLHALPGKYLFDPVCETGGMTLKWFRDAFCQDEVTCAREGDQDAYDLITALAAEIAPGCEGLVMLPHLTGAFSPEYEPAARGVFAGFTLAHGKAHFARAVLEAVAFMLRRNLDLVREAGIEIREIRATGGGARSPLWRQIKADVCQLPVVTLQVEDTALLGDAMLAAVAVGQFKTLPEAADSMVSLGEQTHPDPGKLAAYDAAFNRYVRTFDAMAPVFRESTD
ncbi:MAG: FGGY family carbohydrate kinase [Anaerolineales bacterium]